jgi:hypothetical protein
MDAEMILLFVGWVVVILMLYGKYSKKMKR